MQVAPAGQKAKKEKKNFSRRVRITMEAAPHAVLSAFFLRQPTCDSDKTRLYLYFCGSLGTIAALERRASRAPSFDFFFGDDETPLASNHHLLLLLHLSLSLFSSFSKSATHQAQRSQRRPEPPSRRQRGRIAPFVKSEEKKGVFFFFDDEVEEGRSGRKKVKSRSEEQQKK